MLLNVWKFFIFSEIVVGGRAPYNVQLMQIYCTEYILMSRGYLMYSDRIGIIIVSPRITRGRNRR